MVRAKRQQPARNPANPFGRGTMTRLSAPDAPDRTQGEEQVFRRRRYPKEILPIFLVGPFLLEYLLCEEWEVWSYLRSVAGSFVPFGAIPIGLFLASRYGVPHLLRRIRGATGRVLCLAVVTGAVSGSVGWLLTPAYAFLSGLDISAARFAAICVIVGITLGVPLEISMHLRARLEHEEEVRREEQKARIEAQLNELVARTNPHFLFNALNTVASLIPEDPDLAERIVERLASMFRYSLDYARHPLVPVAQEIDIVRDYLEVQHARFGHRFDFVIEVDESAGRGLIPPMSLQPLVENAVLHGVSRRTKDGQIHISVRVCGEQLECIVTDNGADANVPTHVGGAKTSIVDLRNRLHLVYGDSGALEATPVPDGGFSARLSVPFEDHAA